MAAHASSGSSASRLAEDLKDDIQQTAGHLRDGATDLAGKALSTAKDYGQQGYEYVSDQAGAIKKSTETLVKKNPWYAIGIAVGTGVVLGYLLRGRNRD
jgi:ElaB/YqjD/DUF883 family membrane-anchored ribosome-binding protein